MNARIFADSYYVNGVAIPASYFTSLDTAQYQAIDGDAGGVLWAPAAGIGIGGAGMWCAGPWQLDPPGLQTSVHFIRDFFVMPPILNVLTHGDNDYIEIVNGGDLSTRSLETPCTIGKDSSGCPIINPEGFVVGASAVMLPGALLAGGLINCTSGIQYRRGGRLLVPLRVHNGAFLASVTVWFQTANHSGVPTILPLFRVHQVDVNGGLTSLGAGAIGDGFEFFSPTPANAAAWNAGGLPQSYTVMTSGGLLVAPQIDTSQFVYFLEVIDEQGTHAVPGNVWLQAVANFIDIPDMRPQ